jgi:hypothetical protein
MRDSDSNSETVVNRSREISEDRWVSIKSELDEAKGTFIGPEPCSPLVEAAKESARLAPLRRADF